MDRPVSCDSMEQEDGTVVCASSTEASLKTKPTRCEMCEKAEAKYRCPGCLIRTCSLSCVQKHKSERHCNGERIKTAYVSIKEFTDANLRSDLHFLEEGSRKADTTRRDFHKYYPKAANFRLRTFVSNARNRGVDLLLMPSGMSRHLQNTSMYHFQSETIHWRVEWRFPQENLTFIDAGFSDAGLIQEGVDSHIKRHLEQTSHHSTTCLAESQTSQPPPANSVSSESRVSEPVVSEDVSRPQHASSEHLTLKCDGEMAKDEETMAVACAAVLQYSAEGGRKYRVFLRVHGLEAAVQRYYELDKTLSLQKNLQGKRIIEFPTLYIVSEQCAHSYATLSADEERELTKTLRSTGRPYPKGHQHHGRGRGRGRRHRPQYRDSDTYNPSSQIFKP